MIARLEGENERKRGRQCEGKTWVTEREDGGRCWLPSPLIAQTMTTSFSNITSLQSLFFLCVFQGQ